MSISACSQHPQRWPVATEWQLSAPLNLPSTTLAWKTPAGAFTGAVGRAWRKCLPPPRWPAELSQPPNQGHALRGPDFIITKPFLLQPAWNWLRETFHSIFSKQFSLSLALSFHLKQTAKDASKESRSAVYTPVMPLGTAEALKSYKMLNVQVMEFFFIRIILIIHMESV